MIADLYDLRVVLEGYAIRQAVEHATDEAVDELERDGAEFARGIEESDFVRAEKANVAFHTTIIDLSGNEMLAGMMRNMNIIRKAFQFAYSLRPERQAIPSPHSHEDIIVSLKEREAEACETTLRKHILVGKRRMLEQALGFKID